MLKTAFISLVVVTGILVIYHLSIKSNIDDFFPDSTILQHVWANTRIFDYKGVFQTPFQITGNLNYSSARDWMEDMEATYKKLKARNWMEEMEEKFEKINEKIHQVCKKVGFKSKPIPANEGNRIIWKHQSPLLLDTNHRLGYCGHAKVGSTTWMTYFEKLMNPSQRKEYVEQDLPIHRNIKSIFNSFDSITNSTIPNLKVSSFVSELNIFLAKNRMLTFSFVRHPFERLVSAYKAKALNGILKNIAGLKFPDFINVVLKEYDKEKECLRSRNNTCSTVMINSNW